jgi:hypothetical protein
MAVGLPADAPRRVARGGGVALLIENLDLSGLDQPLERGTLEGVVGDLAPPGEPEVQGLAAGERDADGLA